MIERSLQFNEFWPLKPLFKNSEVHQDYNSQSGSPFGSVWAHFLTFSCVLGSVCDFQVVLSAHTFPCLCVGHEPKARVVTQMIFIVTKF
jgi:hypothetical protein